MRVILSHPFIQVRYYFTIPLNRSFDPISVIFPHKLVADELWKIVLGIFSDKSIQIVTSNSEIYRTLCTGQIRNIMKAISRIGKPYVFHGDCV